MLDPISALGNIYSVTKLIYAQVQLVKANQTQCKRLAERIGIIEQSVHALDQINDKSQYQKGLNDLLEGLQRCLQFMKQLSEAGSFMAFVKAGNYTQALADLNEELQKSIQQLNLGLVAQQIFNREKDKLDQQADIAYIHRNHKEIISELQKNNIGIGKLDVALQENHDILMNQFESMKALLLTFHQSIEKPPIDPHYLAPYFELVFDEKLGSGSFGKIYLGRWRGQRTVIKSIEGVLNAEDKEHFIREVQIMSQCRDKHITQFYGASLESEGRACLLMEYMERGSLYQVLEKPLAVPLQKQMALEIARGLQYLHAHGILHRDLKSANVLVNADNHAKLSDFGLSHTKATSVKTTKKASTATRWLAPECFTRGLYTAQSDIYSYGVILWELVTGKRPYADITEVEIAERTKQGKRESLDGIVEPYGTLIKRCWAIDPTQRPTLDYIIQTLEQYSFSLDSPPSTQPGKAITVARRIEYTELSLGKELGRGGFGVVYQGTWGKHTDVAIKKLLFDDISAEASEEFDAECQLMDRLRSPHIVQFYGYCFKPRCIIMEYMPNGSLFSVLKSTAPLDWTIRIRIAIDIASGLAFLHQEHVLHRDVKSFNVLLNQSYGAKLTDFGLSKVKTETKSHTMATKTSKDSVGTVAWMAPELFKRKPVYTPKSDIYSLGITFWELAARKIPYSNDAQEAIPAFVQQGEREDIPQDCPQKLASLITACWANSPTERPDADTVVSYLKSDTNDFAKFLPLFASYRADSQYQSNLHSGQAQGPAAYLPQASPAPILEVSEVGPSPAKRRVSNIINLTDKKSEREKARTVLEALRNLFLEERDMGEKTENYTLYNEYLKQFPNEAMLVYKAAQNKHVLYINDDPLDAATAAKEISKMIKSLASDVSPKPETTSSSAAITSLIEAIKQNDQDAFSRLLNLKTDSVGKRVLDEVDTEFEGGPIYWAAAFDHVHFIEPLIKAGADVNKQDKDGRTPIYKAAFSGHAKAITALKAVGAHVDTPNKKGETPVYAAASCEHAAAITALKSAGANVDIPNNYGLTPVFVAACNGHVAAIAALKAAGANMNTPCNGLTPIFAAAHYGHADAIAALKAAGASNVDKPNENGTTPIYMAAWKGHVAAVSALLAAGADASIRTPGGTPLEHAKQGTEPGHAEVVRILEAHFKQYPNGIKPDSPKPPVTTPVCSRDIRPAQTDSGTDKSTSAESENWDGISGGFSRPRSQPVRVMNQEISAKPTSFPKQESLPQILHQSKATDWKQSSFSLIAAVIQNKQEEVLRLITLNTTPFGKRFIDEVDKYEENVLCYAACYDRSHFVDPFVKAGVNVNKPDKYGKTPVCFAASREHADVLTALLEAGADASIIKEGTKAASEYVKNRKIAGLLKAHFKLYPSGIKPVQGINQENVMQTASNYWKTLSLIKVIQDNEQEEVFRLLHLNITPFGKRFIDEVDEYFGAGVLYWAARHGHVHFIAPLVKVGANINKLSKHFETPVYVAAYCGHAEAIVALKAAGANIDTQDQYGKTPVFIAAEKGHVKALTALLELGANASIKTDEGITALKSAKNREIAGILKAHFKQYPNGVKPVTDMDQQGLLTTNPSEQKGPPILTQLNLSTTPAPKMLSGKLGNLLKNR